MHRLKRKKTSCFTEKRDMELHSAGFGLIRRGYQLDVSRRDTMPLMIGCRPVSNTPDYIVLMKRTLDGSPSKALLILYKPPILLHGHSIIT